MSDTLERYFNQYLAPYEKAAMEIGEEKGMEKGIVQGQKKEALETVRRMVNNGFRDSDIAIATNLSAAEIEKTRKSMN